MRQRNSVRSGWVAWIALAGLVSGCGGESPFAPPIPREQLLNAPETLIMGSYTIQATPFLSRDFMPVSPPEGRPLMAGTSLRVPGVSPFPSIPMREAYVWVFNHDDVWSTKAKITNFGPYVDIMAGGGPLWGPGITVTLVLGIRDDVGDMHLLLHRDVLIERDE